MTSRIRMYAHSEGETIPSRKSRLVEHPLHTEQQWSRQQRQRYRTKLRETFAVIGENPLIGSRVETTLPEVHQHAVEEHIVFYRLHENDVEIVRILHHRMDVSSLLGE